MQGPKEQESPVLAMASGFYCERPVLPVLRRHFSSVWLHYKRSGATAQSAVVPNACADLLWCGGKLAIAGPDRQVALEIVPPATTVVGIRFLPGVMPALLRVPASEILGARLPLGYLWNSKAQKLIDALGNTQEPYLIAKRLEQALASMAGEFASPDPSAAIILRYAAKPGDPRRPTIRELMSALDISERTLRRHCEYAFGYGPKSLDRVLRMQRFLELARTDPGLGLASLAGIAGYADQAHLNREARRLTGLTPAAVLAQLSG